MEKITVIIPIYNAEKFIDRCLQTVLNQTYSNLEIILINDGSTDKSRKICEDISKSDDRIKLINTSNEGSSAARNKGIDCATGKYIMFVDVDDYIDKTMISELYKSIKENSAQLAISGYKCVNEQKIIYIKKCNKVKKINEDIFVHELLREKYFIGSLWGKLFDATIIKKYRLSEKLTIAEDLDFLFEISKELRNIIILDKILYFYYNNTQSVTKKSDFNKFEDELNVLNKVVGNIKEKNKKIAICRLCRIAIDLYWRFAENNIRARKMCHEILCKYKHTILFASYFSLKYKIKYTLILNKEFWKRDGCNEYEKDWDINDK